MFKSQAPRKSKHGRRKRGKRLLEVRGERNLLSGWWLLGLAAVALLVAAFGVWLTGLNPVMLKDFLSH